MLDRPARKQVSGRAHVCLPLASLCFLVLISSVSYASEARKTPIVKAVLAVREAIVNIRGEKTIDVHSASTSASDPGRRVNGMGTGVVIDDRGYIVTNHHVVDGVREIQVTLANSDKHIARLVARDLETDLAIIKIDPKGPLKVIRIGTSSDLMAGESVIAVGNAYGYPHTVTRGIISALHRAVQVSDAQFYDDLIQTDASINPGNSGGPLLNIDGEMIGINVAVRAGAQGIGFAIPVDKVMAVAGDLIATCNLRRASHGLAVSKAKPGEKGVVITSVEPDSPGAEAGVQVGDRITSVNDMEIVRPLDFHRAMLDLKAGEQLEFGVQRKDERIAMSLTLSDSTTETTASQPGWELLGLELKPIPSDDFRQTFQTRYRGGLTVVNVRPDSPASNQGIRRGDVLVGMHIWETISLENVSYILNRPDFSTINPLKFFILRGNETLYGYIPVAMKKSATDK